MVVLQDVCPKCKSSNYVMITKFLDDFDYAVYEHRICRDCEQEFFTDIDYDIKDENQKLATINELSCNAICGIQDAWINPQGIIWDCKEYNHNFVAENLLGKTETKLYNDGWLKISSKKFYTRKILSDQQANLVFYFMEENEVDKVFYNDKKLTLREILDLQEII